MNAKCVHNHDCSYDKQWCLKRGRDEIEGSNTVSMKTRNKYRKKSTPCSIPQQKEEFHAERNEKLLCLQHNYLYITRPAMDLHVYDRYEDLGLILQNLIACCRFWGSPWESLWSISLLQPGRDRVSVSIALSSGRQAGRWTRGSWI